MQVSPPSSLPSQVSPGCRKPSPQAADSHAVVQASWSSMLPSSQTSPASMLTVLSPQLTSEQSASHCADSMPSSHSSMPTQMYPSPQLAAVQSFKQSSAMTMLPSSHSSP